MSDKTAIEWTDATWNPVTGCTKVSAGCKHCYAEREWRRMTKLVPAYTGRDFTDVLTHADRLDQPLRWKKPRKVFVNSMSDLFHDAVPNEFIDRVFAVMALASRHTFQVLTKRPERMRDYLSSGDVVQRVIHQAFKLDCEAGAWMNADHNIGGHKIMPLPNVWLGVSVEDQAAANERIPLLLDTPAAVRWISAEPLLGSVDLVVPFAGAKVNSARGARPGIPPLDWVVVGGESGPKARPMHPQWARDLRDQCAAAGVPFLFKQWGEWVPRSSCYHTFEDGLSCADLDPGASKWPCIRLNENGGDGHRLEDEDGGDSAYMQRVGKKRAGRLLDGVTHDGYPEGDKA